MDRRSYLAGATLGVVGLAGCTDDGDTATESRSGTEAGATGTAADAGTATTGTEGGGTATGSGDATATGEEGGGGTGGDGAGDQTSTGTDGGTEGDVGFQVRVEYAGEWSGTVSTGFDSRTIVGEGPTTVDVAGASEYVGVNVQKQSEGRDTLTLQVLREGDVVDETSTDVERGVAQVTVGDLPNADTTFAFVVEYAGQWKGTITAGRAGWTVFGTGTGSVPIEGEPTFISADGEKQDGSTDEMTVRLTRDGEVVEESSTSQEFGKTSVTYSGS